MSADAGECPICCEAFSYDSLNSAASPFTYGACRHATCFACAARTVTALLEELCSKDGVPPSGYLSPAKMKDELPGLLCPLCCLTPLDRQRASERHWERVRALRADAARAPAWRVRVALDRPWRVDLRDLSGTGTTPFSLRLDPAAGELELAARRAPGGAWEGAQPGSPPLRLPARAFFGAAMGGEVEVDVAVTRQGVRAVALSALAAAAGAPALPAALTATSTPLGPAWSIPWGAEEVCALALAALAVPPAAPRRWQAIASSMASARDSLGAPLPKRPEASYKAACACLAAGRDAGGCGTLLSAFQAWASARCDAFLPAPRAILGNLGALHSGAAAPGPVGSAAGALSSDHWEAFVGASALRELTLFAAGTEAPLPRVGLHRAEQGIALHSLFLAATARQASCVPGGGALIPSEGPGEGVGGGAEGQPPSRLSLRISSSSSSGSSGGGGSGGGGATPRFSRVPQTPSLTLALRCPNTCCGVLLAVPLPPPSAPPMQRGVHYRCNGCSSGLCGACGALWCGSGALSHAGLSCEAFAALRARAQRTTVEVEETEETAGLTKVCPNPTCGRLISRPRGHACHSVTCSGCSLNFCYVCLCTSVERDMPMHAACPPVCDDTCGCAPCGDCARGSPCAFCTEPAGTGCTTCKLGSRRETPEELGERLARQASAVAARKARHPTWPGPRSFRTDVPLGIKESLDDDEEEEGSEAEGGRAGGGDGNGALAANLWLSAAFSTELRGPAAAVREGLQLLDSTLRDALGEGGGAGGLYLVQGTLGLTALLPAQALEAAPEGAGAGPAAAPRAPRTSMATFSKGDRVRRWPGFTGTLAPCEPGCEEAHDDDALCTVCGSAWEMHSDHTCPQAQPVEGRFLVGVPSQAPHLPPDHPILPEGTSGTVLGRGMELLLTRDPALAPYLCAVEEALALLHVGMVGEEEAGAGAGAGAPPDPAASGHPRRCADAMPSRQTLCSGGSMAAAECGLAPRLPPEDLWYASGLSAPEGAQGRLSAARASSLGRYFTLASACLAQPPPSPFARRHALSLLTFFHCLVALPPAGDAGAEGAGGISATTRRASRRAGWVLELLSLQGVQLLAGALELGGAGAGATPEDAAIAALAGSIVERMAGDGVAVAAAAGWAKWARKVRSQRLDRLRVGDVVVLVPGGDEDGPLGGGVVGTIEADDMDRACALRCSYGALSCV